MARMTLTLHHLATSRSTRILWLLEELQLPYELKVYQRDKATRLAPPELKKIHPLGKSPVITDGPEVLANTTNYAAILTGQPQSLKSRLGTVGPREPVAPEPNKDLP